MPPRACPAGSRLADAPPPRLRPPRPPAPSRRRLFPGLFGLGLPELVVIGGITVLLFGPSKIPELGKTLGKTAKSFQGAAEEFKSELKSGLEEGDGEGGEGEASAPTGGGGGGGDSEEAAED